MEESNSSKTKIAIITRKDYRSPRILAESLKNQFNKLGVTADLFYEIEVLTRLNSFKEIKHKFKFHFWLRRKLQNLVVDRKFLNKLFGYDAIIVCECTPNGFWKDFYNIELLKKKVGKPVLFYEVYYLGNAPTQIAKLAAAGHPLMERYDWHLSVADVTEIRSKEPGPWSCVGLDLTVSGLKPKAKNEFVALIDFSQQGYERYQEEQISILSQLNIKTIILKGTYTLNEIRALYRQASVFFIQFPEAFGLPIAECLACGTQIFTADSGWPMSWRLDVNPEVHGKGILPNIFNIYSSAADLKQKLISLRSTYDFYQTPIDVYKTFLHHYPHYYYGNAAEVQNVLARIRTKNFI
jgi:hypothetical protein